MVYRMRPGRLFLSFVLLAGNLERATAGYEYFSGGNRLSVACAS